MLNQKPEHQMRVNAQLFISLLILDCLSLNQYLSSSNLLAWQGDPDLPTLTHHLFSCFILVGTVLDTIFNI